MKLFLFVLLSLPLSVLADGGLPNQPYIYVQGRAEIEKPADIVILRFNLVARDADQAKANREVQTNAAKILALFDSRKIAAKDVIAEDLRSEPQYENDENDSPKRGKLIGYSVTRPFAVKVRDVTTFAKLANEIIAIGGVEFSRIDTGLSKEKEMQEEAWEKAIANARERAEKTLKTMGMKIDSVFAVSPSSFPEIQREIFGSGYNEHRVMAAETGPGAPDPLQYRLAPITISQSVHVIYLISPAK